MSGPQPTLTLDDFRRGAHKLAELRREARENYQTYTAEEAEAEHDYRVTRAKVFTRERHEGEPAGAAEIVAEAAAADAKQSRNLASSKAKASLLRIEELERDAATLRALAEWSRAIDGGAS